jgi:hypothetical protein
MIDWGVFGYMMMTALLLWVAFMIAKGHNGRLK